ncbi:MAG: hypothetical protein H6799_02400 [Candidatus Nomurabacteria bacterium]|nr:MAG: hypothetical protein H6799_02400 [Candidatus Nomurabacteria bacterium]HRV75855.1 hypothetical protein [Candidatus Saccharimonadales bacterium]
MIRDVLVNIFEVKPLPINSTIFPADFELAKKRRNYLSAISVALGAASLLWANRYGLGDGLDILASEMSFAASMANAVNSHAVAKYGRYLKAEDFYEGPGQSSSVELEPVVV